jgi:hypothetical protein
MSVDPLPTMFWRLIVADSVGHIPDLTTSVPSDLYKAVLPRSIWIDFNLH